MIRVLHVIHCMDCGGTENFIMNLYRNIDRTKVQFDFLVHTQKKCFFDDEISYLGGNIYRVPYYNIFNIQTYKKALNKLFQKHKEWRIIHGHLGSCACIYLRIANKYGLYTIAHSHAINNKIITVKELLYRCHAFLTRGVSNYYMGCSYEAGVDRYGKQIADSNKFKIIYNGIKSEDYIFNSDVRNNVRLEFGIKNRYVVGHIGRFNRVKNHAFMLEVLVELKKINTDYVMMFVGDGELKLDIENQAKALGVYDSIIFTGIRNDVHRMLQAMDHFIFPSFNEGLGIGLIEAQASGLQCTANSEGIMPLAKVCNCVELIPISLGAARWAGRINKTRENEFERFNMSSIIKNAGFDIVEVVKSLECFYLSKR